MPEPKVKQVFSAQSAANGRRRKSPTAPRGAVLLFAAPALLLYGFAVLIPGAQGISYAFTDWDGLSAGIDFVGVDNIAAILGDPAARAALMNTLSHRCRLHRRSEYFWPGAGARTEHAHKDGRRTQDFVLSLLS